jgi:hypothetical protein
MAATVHIVHCIDTEGPLYESLDATFERLQSIFGLDLEPTAENLAALQAGRIDLGEKTQAVQRVVDPHLLAYNDTWDKVDALLDDCLSRPYRDRLLDSEGGGWIYNWFCVDHVDYEVNPRRRDMGYHNVFDHYRRKLRDTGSAEDGLHFHYHPHDFRKRANRCAAHWWASSDSLQQTLSRRVIDRQWFPAAHRAGFHVIRPESHWFLEQFIPFDFSNQAAVPTPEDAAQSGLEDGRWGDWRRAPNTWTPYHPAHDDYQAPGDCRRWVARCLNVGTRYRLLRESDVRQGFAEAREGRPVILAFTNHDFRDIRPDVEGVRGMLARVQGDFPDVPFRFSEAVDAMRRAVGLSTPPDWRLTATLRSLGAAGHALEVEASAPVFGPQPWLALQTVDGAYHNDNFDIDQPFRRWRYVFDEETFPLNALSAVGVAANDAAGTTSVVVLDIPSGRVTERLWNVARAGSGNEAGGAHE